MKVLIVEDSPEKSNEIRKSLMELGITKITGANEYVTGRNLALHEDFDLLVVDMTMPKFSDAEQPVSCAGKELLFDLLDEDKYIPSIVITGYLDFGSGLRKLKDSVPKLPGRLLNPNYGHILESDPDKSYDYSDYWKLHAYLSEKIPFYIGILYFQLEQQTWKEELKSIIQKWMAECLK